MTSETTITILPTHLRLVHIPLGQLHAEMSRILDCWWFRRKDDPFFALCHNGVELSLFADAKAVRRCFADCISPRPPPSSDTKGKSREDKDDKPVVGDDLFIALEIAFGGNGWSTAAPRLQALTSPLASAGISIFFISTFYADYILLRSSALPLATEILEQEGFGFAEADEGMEEEMRAFREREEEEMSAAGIGVSGARTPRRSSGWADEDELFASGMMGSLVLSDAGSGSAGGSRDRSGSRTGSTSASRSNSLSLSRSNSLSMSSSTPLSPPLATSSPSSSPSLVAQAAGFSTTSPDAPPLSLLPDELVCVGLSPAHESVWRSKIVETLFFPERVLPRPSGSSITGAPSSSSGTRAREGKDRSESLTTSSFPLDLSRPSAPHDPIPPASSHLPPPPSSSRPTPLRSPSTTLPTPLSPHPTPFLALTQTAEGTSLIADVRLLRKVFCEGGEGEEEKGVWVSGEGGLGGAWEGEEGVEGWEAEEEEEDEEAGMTTASEDESGSSVRSSVSEDEGWEPVSPGTSARDVTEDEEEQEGEGASERTLLKCLQLDLTRFGLDKPGLVEYYTSLLIEGGVRSLLYQSTFGSANILVAKRDVDTSTSAAMCSHKPTDTPDQSTLLQAILTELQQLKANQSVFEHKLESLALAPTSPSSPPSLASIPPLNGFSSDQQVTATPLIKATDTPLSPSLPARKDAAQSTWGSRVILTTYPGQVGINPIPLKWGAATPEERGPVVASRQPKSLKVRNAIGAYSGSYSIYRALAAASGLIDPKHKPDYTNTEPPVTIPHSPSWDDKTKIVALDPYGHLVPTAYKSYLDAGIDARPTIAITRAHIKLNDFDDAVKAGDLEVDGKIVVHCPTEWINQNRMESAAAKTARAADDAATKHIASAQFDAGVEINVSKAAVEPVWYLPGVAERFGITEGHLRRALYEECGGAYPELMTRPDLKVFLPPIGGLTVYIFGNPDYLRDETKEVTVRVHDECNGSDVFGSDICTCRPYLIFGMMEAIKCAQRGGVGAVIYHRKEGRALGEVTKYLVYNARKRGGDNAQDYFRRTEDIAGVKDMRFQALMPDVLHWLGIKRIDNMISMSDMKYDAIVNSGIPIVNRYEIPEDLIPPDSKVEIDAKIFAGYHSTTKVTDLSKTAGRLWEDLAH
ncbi:Uracil-regulated protein 1 [Rhodotorula toruloides]|nr:Uracil-regulated protein 1 [Rhodotorula toruloides]